MNNLKNFISRFIKLNRNIKIKNSQKILNVIFRFSLNLTLLIPISFSSLLIAENLKNDLKETDIREELSNLIKRAQKTKTGDQILEELIKSARKNAKNRNHKEALEGYQEIFRLFNLDNHPLKDVLLFEKALLYSENNNFYEAIKILESLKIREVNLFAILDINIELSRLYSYIYKIDKSQKIAFESLDLIRKNNIKETVRNAEIYIQISRIYKLKSNYEEEEKYIKLALESMLRIEDKFSKEFFLKVGLALGRCYLAQNKFIETENLISDAVEVIKSFNPLEAELYFDLINLSGEYFVLQNELAKADAIYSKGLEHIKKAYGEESHQAAVFIYRLAIINNRKGFHDKSYALLEKSIEINNKLNDIEGVDNIENFSLLLDLAITYLNRKELEKSLNLVNRSLKIYKDRFGTNTQTLLFADILVLKGAIKSSLNKFEESEKLFKKALKIQKMIGSEYLQIAKTYKYLGKIYFENNLLNDAENNLRESLKIIRLIGSKKSDEFKNNNFYPLNKVLTSLATIERIKGDNKNAISKLYEAVNNDIKYLKKEIQFLSTENRELFLSELSNSFEMAFSYAFQSEEGAKLALHARINRQGLLAEIEKNQSLFSSLTSDQEKIIKKIKNITQSISSKYVSEDLKVTLLERKVFLEKKLYKLLPEIKPEIISLEKIIKAMPEDSYLLEFQKYNPLLNSNLFKSLNKSEERYMALLLKPNGDVKAFDLGDSKLIDKKIIEALDATTAIPLKENVQNLWNEIGELLLKPINEHIKNSNTIFITPDSEINRISFSAISSENKFLMDNKINIRLLTSGRDLISLTNSKKNNLNKSLVVANPSFDLYKVKDEIINKRVFTNNFQRRSSDFTFEKFKPLPWTDLEGEEISNLISANLIKEDDATSLNIQSIKSPKILHIASHAKFLPDKSDKGNPLLRSFIVLAGANNYLLNPNDDGYLTAYEVSKLDLKGTELVVISGCDSSRGDIKSGEGVYGLKRAIQVAGSKSSLLSLWQIDDRATSVFMKSFYKNLLKGMDKYEALNATINEFKNSPIPIWRHPFYWAGFQLSGDWRKINFD